MKKFGIVLAAMVMMALTSGSAMAWGGYNGGHNGGGYNGGGYNGGGYHGGGCY